MKNSSTLRTSDSGGDIHVHIEKLVVDGFSVSNRDHLGVVVQQQLQGLIAATGLPGLAKSAAAGDAHIAAVRAGKIRTPKRSSAHAAGEKIARAIHGGLHR